MGVSYSLVKLDAVEDGETSPKPKPRHLVGADVSEGAEIQ
jgi:hypothetical protein